MSPQLRLYDTLTRTKQPFTPIDPANVRMYVCGPTVYDYAHIGNARPVIVFDVLFRLLRHLYGEKAVTYARNLTDVDDKINARAVRDFPGLPLNEAIAKVTESTTAQFHKDVAALGNLPPTHEPRATGHIAEMKAIIERLVARGVAYVAEEHVLFHVPAVASLGKAPRYGSLARRSLDEMVAGARVDVAPYKRDAMDFVLWKPSVPGRDPAWPSPAGIATPGRPGWHIECSAMAMKTLLEPFGGGLSCDDPEKNLFDIHGGGIDLVFPHHENEIAQSCCAFGPAGQGAGAMARIWMHNGFLQVEGEKMSKSLGNFVTIHELLETDTFGGRRWPGEVLRLAMLKTHYRQPIDWTVKALEEAEREIDEWRRVIRLMPEPVARPVVVDALLNDLNTSAALTSVRALVKRSFDPKEMEQIDIASDFAASLRFLGFDVLVDEAESRERPHSERLDMLLDQSWEKLTAQGLGLDTDLVEKRLADRTAARRAKNFAESDRIRDELAAMGIALKDGKDPVTGEPTTSWEVKR